MTAVQAPPRRRLTRGGRPPAGQLLGPTTPGRLRLSLIGLISISLIWGALAAWVVNLRASGANDVVSISEAVSLDGQQIYRSLSDADATAATAFLSGGLEPVSIRQRYLADIALAASRLNAAAETAGHSAAAADLATLSLKLPVYAGEVETARANNRLGLPLGAAYLREASSLMRGTLLPAARRVSAQADAQLAASSGTATGQPLLVVLLAAAVLAGYALYRAQRWLARRTHRRLNVGLLAASVAGLLSLVWLAAALEVARSDLLLARDHGSAPVAALSRAEIAGLRARADESLTLIDSSGDDSFQADFVTVQRRLGPGPGTLLTGARLASQGSPGAPQAAAASGIASAWFAAHRTVRSLDDNGQHANAVRLVTAPGPGHSQTLFSRLDGALTTAIARDQAVFRSSAAAARNAFTALEAGIIVLSLIMAAGCALGISTRLAEYR